MKTKTGLLIHRNKIHGLRTTCTPSASIGKPDSLKWPKPHGNLIKLHIYTNGKKKLYSAG